MMRSRPRMLLAVGVVALLWSGRALSYSVNDGAKEAGTRTRTFTVYDVRGRLVTRWRATVGAGGRVTWNGRGSDGQRVGTGIYLFRAEDGPRGSALRIVIAR